MVHGRDSGGTQSRRFGALIGADGTFEVAAKYGETPEIREVPTEENPWKYAVKGRDNNGDTRTLQHATTRTEAAEAKADFQRTRGDEFRCIWIEKVA